MTTSIDIFKAAHKTTPVTLTELGNTQVFIREIGVIDIQKMHILREELVKHVEEVDGVTDEKQLQAANHKAIEICAILFSVEDGKGGLVFSADDIQGLFDLPTRAYTELVRHVIDHSGVF